MSIQKHMGMLGLKVRDRVTGMKGVVTSVGFDLFGCVQCIVNPGIDKEGKASDSLWFDVARLEVKSQKPVMPVPDFNGAPLVAEGRKGPADKPRTMKP